MPPQKQLFGLGCAKLYLIIKKLPLITDACSFSGDIGKTVMLWDKIEK